jgi:hypothetical protein
MYIYLISVLCNIGILHEEMKSQRLNKEKQLWKTATVCGQLKEDKSDFNKVFF